jgi:hypothetical protein
MGTRAEDEKYMIRFKIAEYGETDKKWKYFLMFLKDEKILNSYNVNDAVKMSKEKAEKTKKEILRRYKEIWFWCKISEIEIVCFKKYREIEISRFELMEI